MVFGKGGANKPRNQRTSRSKNGRKQMKVALALSVAAKKQEEVLAAPAENMDSSSSSSSSSADESSGDVSLSSSTRKRKKKPTMKERKDEGYLVCNQTQARTYIFVAYVKRYNEPDESDWPNIITTLATETGMDRRSIEAVFVKCRNGDPNPELQAEGAGRPRKLERTNPGLVAAALV
jgi:hypothetical protein